MSLAARVVNASEKDGRKAERERKRRELYREIRRYRYLYPMLIFGVAFFIVFAYVPMYGIQLAFKSYNIGKGITGSDWVGLANFNKLFARTEFWGAFNNTIIISLLKTITFFPVPIILAILINEVGRKLGRTLQIVYTLPHFLSWVTISAIMMNLFASSGAVNGLIDQLGGENVKFLNDGGIFRVLLVTTQIWKEAGWSCIIYMAAIAGIDQSQYESATIDGATRFQKALFITLPSLKNVAAILLLLSIGHAMDAGFDQVFNMYNPTVYQSADIIDTYIYRISFMQAADYGLSTALGLFKGVINCALLLIANFVVGKMSAESKII
ncbi:MAG: binding-protein-dependent transport system inner rane component [Paenibacillaceae bacterium]|jgi:putative aldouronate transport system permease protein|nr:binding-protein-dependent transport system inner rane component [Paenibacillaceae bacterium]